MPPGEYTIKLVVEEQVFETKCVLQKNPLYKVDDETYRQHSQFMNAMEQKLDAMHSQVTALKKAQDQLAKIIKEIEADKTNEKLVIEGKALIKKLVNWDEDMVQRKSKAYDDVENFENKFTAEYIYLINSSDSSIPQVNKSSELRKVELDKQWELLKSQANQLVNKAIPQFNESLWKSGIGAIRI